MALSFLPHGLFKDLTPEHFRQHPDAVPGLRLVQGTWCECGDGILIREGDSWVAYYRLVFQKDDKAK